MGFYLRHFLYFAALTMEQLRNSTDEANFTSPQTTTTQMYTNGYLSENPNKAPTDLLNIILTTLGCFVASTSLLCNGCVFQALRKVSSEDLKSKLFIMNAVIIDGICPLPYVIKSVEYVVAAIWVSDDFLFTCAEGVRYTLSTVFQYLQAMSALMLAFDRFYAVYAPLKYFCRPYSRLVSSVIISAMWLLSVALVLPMLLSPITSGHADEFCRFLLLASKNLNLRLKSAIFIALNSLALGLYIAVFIQLGCRRRIVMTRGSNSRVHATGSSSIAVTFFIIYFSTLAIYIPAPILSLSKEYFTFKTSSSAMQSLPLCLMLLFFFNCSINAAIAGYRIPAIRTELARMWQSVPNRVIRYPKSN